MKLGNNSTAKRNTPASVSMRNTGGYNKSILKANNNFNDFFNED